MSLVSSFRSVIISTTSSLNYIIYNIKFTNVINGLFYQEVSKIGKFEIEIQVPHNSIIF